MLALSALRKASADGRRSEFATMLRRAKLPPAVPEYRFHDERLWRFDYAWPMHHVALEVEGGVWTAGRHTRATGFLRDMEKYNAAVLDGWRVLRTVPDHLTGLTVETMLRRALGER